MGNVLQAGQGQAPARQAVLGAGIPSLDTGVEGFLSLCSWSLLGHELKQSGGQPFVRTVCGCFFPCGGWRVCVALMQVGRYCLQCLQNLEKAVGDQAGNSTVCYINGGYCSETFTKWAFFLQYIVILKCYCIRSQWVSFSTWVCLYTHLPVESGADTGRIHCVMLAVTWMLLGCRNYFLLPSVGMGFHTLACS